MFLSIFRFLCGISFLKLRLFIILCVWWRTKSGMAVVTRSEGNGQSVLSSHLWFLGIKLGLPGLVTHTCTWHVWLCAMRTRKPEKAPDTLKLEEMALSHPVGSGTLTQFLW